MEIPESFRTNGGAAIDEIDAVEGELSYRFPADFREFLAETGGGEGFWGEGYLAILAPNEIVEVERLHGFENLIPDLILFGSDGGGEFFGLSRQSARYVMTPMIGDEPAMRVDGGAKLEEFLKFVERGASR